MMKSVGRGSAASWRRLGVLACVTLWAAACNGEPDPDKPADTDTTVTETDEQPAGDVTLELALAETTAVAGSDVDYTVTLTTADGETPTVTSSLASDIEDDLRSSSTDLTPTKAGEHTITATVEYEGETYEAAATLTVTAGELDDLDLVLDDSAFEAGATLGWRVDGLDEWDNIVSAADALVVADSPEVSIDAGGTLTATLAGRYTIEATLGELTDDEVVVVDPAAAAAVSLELSNTQPGLDEAVVATVVVTDAYGNETNDAWTLTVDGTGMFTVGGNSVSFQDEGTYTVTVGVDGTSLEDSVGPFTIDAFPPELVVTTPPRGSHTALSSRAVNGTVSDGVSDIDEVTIDGVSVSVDGTGVFTHDVAADFGLNIVETQAVDEAGRMATDTRAFLQGSLHDAGTALTDAIVVRVEEGPGGFDTLESIGESLIAEQDLDALIPDPLYDAESESCFIVCWTNYAVYLTAEAPTFSGTTFDIDPRSDGTILVTFTVDDLYVDWEADVVVLEIPGNYDGDIRADSLTVSLVLRPSVSNGQVEVELVSVNTSTSNFRVNLDSFVQDALGFFGYDLSGDVEGILVDQVDGVIRDTAPGLIADLLQGLELGYDIDLLGTTLSVTAEPSSIDVSSSAVTVGLSADVGVSPEVIDQDLIGSLTADYDRPSWGAVDGVGVGLSLDFVNQIFYAVRSGGLLDLSLVGSDYGIDGAALAPIFPGVTDVTVEVESNLAPVAVPVGLTNEVELQVGSMRVTLMDDVASVPLLEAWVSALGDLSLSTSGTTVTPTVGDVTAFIDIVVPNDDDGSMATLLEALVPELLPLATDILTEIEIPSFEGYSISVDGAGLDGPQQGYYTLHGNLVEAP